MTTPVIGAPLDRVDGKLKVMGKARYAAEYPEKDMTYAVLLNSTIACGKIRSIDTKEAERYPGVLAVITHQNIPALKPPGGFMTGGAAAEDKTPLTDGKISHMGQYIAVVIAENLEAATEAAKKIQPVYIEDKPVLDWNDKRAERYKPKQNMARMVQKMRGTPDESFSSSEVKVDNTYITPIENHNPIETHATTAVWNGDKLTVYDATQYTNGVQNSLARLFSIPKENVRVVCKFIGGAFGCKGTMWPHVILAALSAKTVNRPVKLVLQRSQMFTNVGHRAETRQRVALGADKTGNLKAIIHTGTSHSSVIGEFIEQYTVATPFLYQCQNVQVGQEIVKLNVPLPTFMRAPGESPGVYALESAIDELAHAAGVDPLELRIKNYAHRDPELNMPFSSKGLMQCYKLGAEKIGWEKRSLKPRQQKDGHLLVGLGMATATYPTMHFNGSVDAILKEDGTFLFESSTHEMGTGTCTAMAQIAADALDVPFADVSFVLGDTDLPPAPVSGGSSTISTIGNGVYGAAKKLQADLAELLTTKESSPFHGATADSIEFADGSITCKTKADVKMPYDQAIRVLGMTKLVSTYKTSFDDRIFKHSSHAFGAQFAEVKVDPDLGIIRVSRFVGAFACGKIINEKTSKSQIHGGITMGIGMALFEKAVTDKRSGRIMNANLGEYHVPVNADIPNIEAHLVPEDDAYIGAIGAKGIGEIGITGVAAAIANAVFNATGIRVRDLPITPDKLLV